MIGNMTIRAYVGSNNTTKELEIDKIIEVLNKHHDGFTIQLSAIGCWQGETEQTAVILLTDSRRKLRATLNELKEELNQEAIVYQVENTLRFV